MEKEKILIIGSSAAALGCINAICNFTNDNEKFEITVVSKDTKLIYSRPIIAEVISGAVAPEKFVYTNSYNFFKKRKINFISSTVVEKIDTTQKNIITNNNKYKTINYSKLVIAAGGKPILPEFILKHKDSNIKDKIFTFTDLQDYQRLSAVLPNIKTAVVVGAGFIGLEIADALAKKNVNIKVIELAPRPLIKSADAFISDIISEQFKKKNIEIICRDSVVEIKRINKNKIELSLQSGAVLETDIIIFAIGVRPNLDLIKDTEISVKLGISIDKNCMTNIPDIFAAGDITEILDITTDKIYPIALWLWAYQTGYTAGANIAGVSKEFNGGFPISPFKFSDMPIISAGEISDDNSITLTAYNRVEKSYQKLVIRNNRITGYILMGIETIKKSGILTALLKKRWNISNLKDKLLTDDFSIADLPKEWRENNE